jgi:KRAB domain-containing zinc finger protein
VHVNSVHGNIRCHKCTQCKFASSQKANLLRHKKFVHDNIKDHKCTHCEFSTSGKGNLMTHVKTVHEKKKLFMTGSRTTGALNVNIHHHKSVPWQHM